MNFTMADAFLFKNNRQAQIVLNDLHKAAKSDGIKVLKALGVGIFKKIEPHHVKSAYLPISKEQGNFMYDVIVKNQYKHIVEFGTSFGISTIYLALAAEQTGGKVVTTEIVPEKCEQAKKNFVSAGVENFIELREGDALESFKNWNQSVDFLLLDGWKDLYLPVFRLLENNFHKNTLVFVDNTNFKGVKHFLKVIQQSSKYQIESMQLDKGNSAIITIKN
ncbi:MAG: class I SAM-dependent methyltransferase [Flavobacterium sp.]|nr:class I SAM-dependent methyltransferase [Sphingobacteriales bacterium]MBP6584641.1 class I SAM-dependent methyltransferase [Flavobacterium sp.]